MTYSYDDELSEKVMVRREERRRAKVGGKHVIAYQKFQSSGISGESHLVIALSELLM